MKKILEIDLKEDGALNKKINKRSFATIIVFAVVTLSLIGAFRIKIDMVHKSFAQIYIQFILYWIVIMFYQEVIKAVFLKIFDKNSKIKVQFKTLALRVKSLENTYEKKDYMKILLYPCMVVIISLFAYKLVLNKMSSLMFVAIFICYMGSIFINIYYAYILSNIRKDAVVKETPFGIQVYEKE